MAELKPCHSCRSPAREPRFEGDRRTCCTNDNCWCSHHACDADDWNTRPIEDAQAAEIARLTGEVEFWKSAAEAQRRKNCDECVRIAEGEMVAKLQARVAELEAMLREIVDSIPATYDETDPTVKRHAEALNAAFVMSKEVGHE